MPKSLDPKVTFNVTPRFELFYGLQAFTGDSDQRLSTWKHDTERRIGPALRGRLKALAPSPLLWPLLADALCDAPVSLQIDDVMEYLSEVGSNEFQRAVLGGVFKGAAGVEALLSGKSDIASTVAAEAPAQGKLLSLLGLLPFDRKNPSVSMMERIVEEPEAYKAEVVEALGSFWSSAFEATWREIEPAMHMTARRWKQLLADKSFLDFASAAQLPITANNGAVTPLRGGLRVPFRLVDGIHVIPSAFNVARLWAAYTNERHHTRFFVPLLDASLPLSGSAPIAPALAFKALGDTTRYAIAMTIARTPMTSVELARKFSVSKPTISHHVQLLRSAGLLNEVNTEKGVELSLNRGAVERISGAAAREMFSRGNAEVEVKRSRRQ
ncbi:MAG TPA: helix-turn-helix domain-containing protein [Gemmatimonadaceae bacterium]|nr:helix-turn-helix domain-containing protein [Gemmatimonadaceae bacterium]